MLEFRCENGDLFWLKLSNILTEILDGLWYHHKAVPEVEKAARLSENGGKPGLRQVKPAR